MFIAELKPVTGRGALAKFKHAIGYKTGLPAIGYDEYIREADRLWDELEKLIDGKISSMKFCFDTNKGVIFIAFTEMRKRMFVCSLDKERLVRVLEGYEILCFIEK